LGVGGEVLWSEAVKREKWQRRPDEVWMVCTTNGIPVSMFLTEQALRCSVKNLSAYSIYHVKLTYEKVQ